MENTVESETGNMRIMNQSSSPCTLPDDTTEILLQSISNVIDRPNDSETDLKNNLNLSKCVSSSEISGIELHAGSEEIEKNKSENICSMHQTESRDISSDPFESTLAHFLKNASYHDEAEISPQEGLSDPVNSIYDLLSDETRDYLSKHYDYSKQATLPKCWENIQPSKGTHEEESKGSAEDDIKVACTNDVITNYMRTMQRYIGRSTFQEKKTSGIDTTQTCEQSVGSHKTISFGNVHRYERLDDVGKQLDPSVRRWLISLRLPNLSKYLSIFEQNEIDAMSLKLLSESQLRHMGITSYGPLNKMLHSIRVMRNFEPPRLPLPPKVNGDTKNEISGTKEIRVKKSVAKKANNRSSSAPSSSRRDSARLTGSDSKMRPNIRSPRKNPSIANHGFKRECLLHLLVENDEETYPSSARSNRSDCKKREVPLSARSQVSEIQLIKKAELEIGRAAKKFQSKLEKDIQKKEAEERLDRMLRDKRLKFAADYQRRQIAAKDSEALETPREVKSTNQIKSDHKKRGRKQKRTPRNTREMPSESTTIQQISSGGRGKENYLDDPQTLVETQMAVDAAKPSLVFEDQLDDLEFQIQNLVDVQMLKQSDSRSLLSCIDHLQNQLHRIQSMVSKQRTSESQNKHDEVKVPTDMEHCERNYQKKTHSPRSDLSAMDLRFNERDFIGEGVFSQVFRGKYMKREVVAKRLKIPLSTEDKSRLSQEVSLLMELKHENICSILGCNIRMKFPILIMQFCNGGSLRQLLQKTEPLDHSAFYQIAEDVCSGLSYLHVRSPLSPRPHLRLTSHNILLDTALRARLSDIGLSRLRHECSRAIRQAGAARAEWSQLPWMAPEVVAGEEAGPSADIYGFGVVLWEMMMRQVPYNGLTAYQMIERIREGPPLTIPDACPVTLKGLIRRCWQLRPGERTTIQEALLCLSRLKFPVSWQTVLQSAGVSHTMMTDILLCRQIISNLLNFAAPYTPELGEMLPPNGPCGLLSFPLPDLELAPVSRIEEFAVKVTHLLSRESRNQKSARACSPLSAELSARGAVWSARRGARLHDQ